jgi:ABC-type Mn2+/Zn2+ transport system permease subunit
VNVVGWFVDPYRGSEFMRMAALSALLVGILAPTVGVWVLLRRLTYLGDAMSHATLGGVALAYLMGFSLTIGALGAGLAMAAIIALLSSGRRLAPDAVIGVAETVLFAIGVILISRSHGVGVDLSHYLFGQITTVRHGDLVLNATLMCIALASLALGFGDLRAATFDPLHARQVGIRTRALDHLLLALVSVTVVVSLQTVGLLMSVAMLVTPAATARLFTTRVTTMTAAAVGLGVTAALGGLTLSYHLAAPPGATISLVAAGQLLVAFAITLVPSRVQQGRPLTL